MTDKYLKSGNLVLERFKTLFAESGWTQVSKNSKGTILLKKDIPTSSIPCYHLETTLNHKATDLASKIWDVNEEIVKKYDGDISYWKEIEKGENWKVCHQTTSAPWPVWPRELAFSQVKIIDKNTIWLVAFSVDHESVPLRDKEYVRANILMSIWGFTEVSPDMTKVQRIVHVEPKGSIPVWLINATVSKHISIVENLGNRT